MVILRTSVRSIQTKVNRTELEECPLEKIFQDDDFPVRAVVRHSKAREVYLQNHHPELEFHLIRHGNSRYSIADVDYNCEKNSVLIIHENEKHSHVTDPESIDKNMSLIFDPKVLLDRPLPHAALCSLDNFHNLLLSDKNANIAEFLLNEIADECEHKGVHWQALVIDHIETFLTILQRSVDLHSQSTECKDELIDQIIEFLEDKFTTKLSLADVSDRFNLSPFTLSRKFKHHLGLGFREYLIQRRIVEAQRLLEQTDLKISAVASKAGFESISTFNRDFRMRTGITAALYRTISGANKHQP